MKTTEEKIEVMQHYANGGDVETRGVLGWVLDPNPKWNWTTYDYRIKQPDDPYAELKVAAADPTKQIRFKYLGDWCGWHDSTYGWKWCYPPEDYEIRDKPKPMKKVKLLAWFTGERLTWMSEDYSPLEHWNRAPSEDKEIEIDE